MEVVVEDDDGHEVVGAPVLTDLVDVVVHGVLRGAAVLVHRPRSVHQQDRERGPL